MKTFLKKLFFTDAPAQGVLTGFILLAASGWIIPGIALLCGFPMKWVWWAIPLIFVFLYAWITALQFLFTVRKQITLCVMLLLVLLVSVKFFLIDLLILLFNLHGSLEPAAMSDMIGNGSYIHVFTIGFPVLAALLIWTRNFPKSFTLTGKIILVIWAAFYLVSLGMAYAAYRNTQNRIAEQEKHFGRPLTAAGWESQYLRHRKTDPAFWTAVENVLQQYEAEIGKAFIPVSDSPECVYTDDTLKGFKPLFERSEPLRKLEKMFDGKLPAAGWCMESGNLYRMALRELNWCRILCRYELWRIRFAIENHDLLSAYAALDRMKNASKHLGKDFAPLISDLCMFSCENYRMNGMELLLATGQVPDPVLKQWTAALVQDEIDLHAAEAESIFTEMVFWNDSMAGFFTGKTVYLSGKKFRFYPLCFLYPPIWHYFERCRSELFTLKGKTWEHIAQQNLDCQGLMARTLQSDMEATAKPFGKMAAKYCAMRALIGIELEKRRTGKYPDKLENPPADPFTGKPMFYKKGKMPLIVKVWDPAVRRFVSEKREADGIAVWSVGPNRKNEQGQDQATVRKYADDVRAKMIFKKDSRD